MVDLGVRSTVSGVVTQGREADRGGGEWVTNFLLSYSDDAHRWEFARDMYGAKKVLRGNSDPYSLRHSYLEHPVRARFVRLHVAGWHGHPSLRMEIIGCQGQRDSSSGRCQDRKVHHRSDSSARMGPGHAMLSALWRQTMAAARIVFKKTACANCQKR